MQANGIAIFGTGAFGEQVYRQCRFRYEVRCFLDNFPKAKEMHGFPIWKLEAFLEKYPEGKRPLIVVATRDYCVEISRQLQLAGLAFGEDYITYQDVTGKMLDYFALRGHHAEAQAVHILSNLRQGKKLAILYGNCQIDGLRRYLLRCPSFLNQYEVMMLPAVFSYSAEKLRLLYEKFWSLCDIFISQRVREDNRFAPELATDRLAARLPAYCKVLWIPNIFFDGYFPQITSNVRNVDKDLHQSGRFPFADVYVDDVCSSGGNVRKLLRDITQEDFLPGETVEAACEVSLMELRKREAICDIKMSDVIKKDYRTRQLFYSVNHPINELLLTECRRILQALGLRDVFVNVHDVDQEFTLKGQDAPIYLSVVNTLGLREYETEFYPNRYLWPFKGNLVEYTEEYLRRCWGMVV